MSSSRFLAASIVAVLAMTSAAVAQGSGSSVGQSWSSTVNPAAPAANGLVLDAKQTEALNAVSKYFTDLKQMKGNFIQTNADGKKLRGRFTVKQPGRFRFDYGSGSKMVIVSDGTYLAIQDLDLKTDDRIELDRTPFRILLRKDVDILRDARVLEVQDTGDLVIVALQDKSPDAPGRIRLFLSRAPELELKEWVTTDAQGLDTKIELSAINKTDAVDDNLFKPAPVGLQKIQ
ncbi:MAG TPA: outer-membrane lipoprotein carrier protein LolA [Hyphomicrobiaceae bacterium]|nr:outer-membrane lipoprotein carrier protein LolA [Hyphomicrobiaceae bacterium]